MFETEPLLPKIRLNLLNQFLVGLFAVEYVLLLLHTLLISVFSIFLLIGAIQVCLIYSCRKTSIL